MTIVVTGHSSSLEGFIAGADDSSERPLGVCGDRLFDWFSDGDTPSRFYSDFKRVSASAALFDEYAGRVGAIITRRRTYDVCDGWGGSGTLCRHRQISPCHPQAAPCSCMHRLSVHGGLGE